MRISVECKIERPLTGSTLTTGIAFNSSKEESRLDHELALERMVREKFRGWRIKSATWVKAK